MKYLPRIKVRKTDKDTVYFDVDTGLLKDGQNYNYVSEEEYLNVYNRCENLKDALREIANRCDHTGPHGELCECSTDMAEIAQKALKERKA